MYCILSMAVSICILRRQILDLPYEILWSTQVGVFFVIDVANSWALANSNCTSEVMPITYFFVMIVFVTLASISCTSQDRELNADKLWRNTELIYVNKARFAITAFDARVNTSPINDLFLPMSLMAHCWLKVRALLSVAFSKAFLNSKLISSVLQIGKYFTE